MNGKDAKKIFIEYSSAKIEQWGFVERKQKTTSAFFYREKSSGVENLSFATFNYYPEVVCTGGASKSVKIVESILKEINNIFSLNLELDESRTIVYFGDSAKRKLSLLEVKNKDKEEGVIKSSDIILNYYKEAITLFDLFDDLREIDKRINGEGENFWESDTSSFKPFSFGSYFFERRLIIAWLCGNSNFEKIADSAFKYIEKSMSKHMDRPFHFDRDDLTLNIPATIKHLKENVSPLY